ncbi:G patch domain-containing protein 8 [Morella rubra]|uniref:G patch domain-containing protein 8 n=1 Tax=Morella rubra TaxID=262757 RepID=A0A6A1VTH4_9ROSI|nr:G patch domain-containing protein 8 [Morella rubra]
MEYEWLNGRQEMSARDEEKEQDSLIEDFTEDFRLPIYHKPTENVDLDDVEQASLDTHLTSSNVGFRLLQKMGWKGKGLGKNEQGMFLVKWKYLYYSYILFSGMEYAGIIEPIKSGIRDPKLGVGKQEQDDFFTAEENIQRRKLDIELEESEEHTKKREVLAEREQKIQTEVKEIRKVFFCDLCNKQYKLAVEFEAHLSSYDHNHRKRFKEMREMHGTSSRDDRQKREQQRQEREMAKFAQMADAHKQQQLLQQQQEDSGSAPVPTDGRGTTSLVVQDQRKTLKFGFSSKGGTSKSLVLWGMVEFEDDLKDHYRSSLGSAAKKPKIAVASVFGNDSDEENSCDCIVHVAYCLIFYVTMSTVNRRFLDGICRRVGEVEVEVIFSLYANLKLLVLANGEKMGL